jgi:hypothetical protein
MPPEEGAATLKLYQELLRIQGEEDLMAADVRGELRATGPRSTGTP